MNHDPVAELRAYEWRIWIDRQMRIIRRISAAFRFQGRVRLLRIEYGIYGKCSKVVGSYWVWTQRTAIGVRIKCTAISVRKQFTAISVRKQCTAIIIQEPDTPNNVRERRTIISNREPCTAISIRKPSTAINIRKPGTTTGGRTRYTAIGVQTQCTALGIQVRHKAAIFIRGIQLVVFEHKMLVFSRQLCIRRG